MFDPTVFDTHFAVKHLLPAFDLAGTFVFALSGALAAVRRRLDLFGVLVLAFAAATCGGIVRDLLIGAVPPAAISDWRYLAVSMVAGIVTFAFPPLINRMRNAVLLFDAAGLALFCVAGAQKALGFGLDPLMAALLGMLTGIGGGMARDMLLSNIPVVLRAEVYAVAALAGAGVVVLGDVLQFNSAVSACTGAGLCFTLRVAAMRYGWHLPTPRLGARSASADAAPDRYDR